MPMSTFDYPSLPDSLNRNKGTAADPELSAPKAKVIPIDRDEAGSTNDVNEDASADGNNLKIDSLPTPDRMPSEKPLHLDDLPLHPACKVFPILSQDELLSLGHSIKADGLQHRLVIFREDGGWLEPNWEADMACTGSARHLPKCKNAPHDC
jgi:hypothetical protein